MRVDLVEVLIEDCEHVGLEAVASGARTSDLGGHLGTSEFTDEVIRRTRSKLEVWATI
jgi:isocitrate/isopropylmalate dehydrogenase